MSSIVTLTTDFGTKDGYVGAMKGRLLSLFPSVNIVDITHEIEPQNILSAALCLKRSVREFSDGTIHLAVIDPGVGSNREALLIKKGNSWFVGPDNGVFSFVVNEYTAVYKINKETRLWNSHQSFDGLHLFIPVVGALLTGVALDEFAELTTAPINRVDFPVSTANEDQIVGEIISFDHFGNALTNISIRSINDMKETASILISCESKSYQLCSCYSDGAQYERFAIVNSDGFIELSVYCGSIREIDCLEKALEVEVPFI